MSVTKFTIDRDTWIRGRSGGTADTPGEESRLLTADGRMCCLGFYLTACGVPEDDLEGTAAPAGVAHDVRVPGWLLAVAPTPGRATTATQVNSVEATTLMEEVNDNLDLTEDERESLVVETFARQGIEVEFTGSGLGFPPGGEP